MKKIFSSFFSAFLCLALLSACSHGESVNLLHFTDNLNSIAGSEKVKLSDYFIKDSDYTLYLSEGGTDFLVTLNENENGKIKKVRLTLSKTDNKGDVISISNEAAELFRKNACDILSAFTFFEGEKSADVLKNLLPQKGADFSKTGELTVDCENYHLVYYSNKICSQFFVTNTFLQETEVTEKPVSRPLYQETANIRED